MSGPARFVLHMAYWKQAVVPLVMLFVAAFAWFYFDHAPAPEPPRQAAGNAPAQGGQPGGGGQSRIPGLISGGAVNVVTAPVEADTVGDTVTALGSATAAHSVVIYPRVAGIVADIVFKPGERVEAGAPLLRLDDDEEQANADRARIQYAQARAAFERSQSLAQSKTISSVALSDAEMTAQLAENQVRLAEIAVSRRLVTAPFAGIVGLTDISVGDLVNTNTAITTIEDLSTVRVSFEVPERWSASVKQGQVITARAQALPGSEFSGTITGIDNHVDATTRTLKLEAELQNTGEVLKAGMAIAVAMTFGGEEQLAVPNLAVQWDRKGSFVWKVAEGAARRADVAIVSRESGIVVVKGDVEAGDRVVVEGLLRLREGAKVNEVNETPDVVDEAPAGGGSGAPEVSGAGATARTRS
jgi:RND family efflux transporter MFP subunit